MTSKQGAKRFRQNNLNWEIGLLEAECGFEPANVVQHKNKKRKRVEDAESHEETEHVSTEKAEKLKQLKEEKVKRKLFHLLKEFHKDAKKAKTFETQRSIKRLKAARKKLDESSDNKNELGKEVATQEKEIEVLKLIEIKKLSNKVFLNAINKHRALKNVEPVQAYLTANEACRTMSLLEDGASADEAILKKVEARLLSSKSLREALSAHLDSLLYTALGTEAIRPSGLEELKDQKKGRSQAKQVPDRSLKVVAKRDNKPSLGKSFGTSRNGNDDEEEDFESGDDTNDPHDLPLEELEKLLAAEETEEMSGNEEEEEVPATKKRRDNLTREKAAQKETRREKPLRPAKKAKKEKGSADSMFVNSLGDGSDFEDPEFDKIYGAKKTKNRMGQQARRALAEKIYGENAKHKIAERAAAAAAAAAVEARRARARRGRDDKPNHPSKQTATEKLHPSWEAAKQRKSVAIIPAQGKKIVFGDDDEQPVGGTQEAKSRADARNAGAPKLHPSWEAAKLKANQSSIVKGQNQNTKIVFDD